MHNKPLETYTVEEVCKIIDPVIRKRKISTEILDVFKTEKIDGSVFKQLTHEKAKLFLQNYPFGDIHSILESRDWILQRETDCSLPGTDDSWSRKPAATTTYAQKTMPYIEKFREFDKPTTSRDT